MKMSLWKVLLAALLIGLLAACGSDSEDPAENQTEGTADTEATEDSADGGVLRMGTAAEFPPFESIDAEGNFEGFDIDLANLIADELGMELKITDMKFDGLIGALGSERIDVAISGMTATEDRKKNVDFSNEYYSSNEVFITKKDSDIKTLEDLEGKVVGVQIGTIQDEGATKLSEEYNFEVKRLDTSNIIIQELVSNRIDVAYMDKPVGVGYIEKQDLDSFDDPTSSSPGMAIAFPKGSELVDDVNAVLEQLEEDGTLQELRDKWELDK